MSKPTFIRTTLLSSCFLAFLAPTSHADSKVMFSFSPPPITSSVKNETRVNKIGAGLTLMSNDAADSDITIIPYAMASLMLLGSSQSIMYISGTESSSDEDIDSTLGVVLGVHFDLGKHSLISAFQKMDDTTIFNINYGIEF